jgi:hypothetical protein
VTARWLQEYRDTLNLTAYATLHMQTPVYLGQMVSFPEFELTGSSSPEFRHEIQNQTPLGEAIRELLILKFNWQSKQKRKVSYDQENDSANE